MTISTQEQQEILKGLFKSAIEKNVEEFEKKLENAKKVGFDFFNTKLSEDYEFNGITMYQDFGLIEDMRMRKQSYSKELIEIFLNQGIITQNNVANLYDNINKIANLTISHNLNFTKLSLDYIRNKSIQIDQKILKAICDAVMNTMCSAFPRCGPHQDSEVQGHILDIEEVVTSLMPLLEEDEKKKFEDAFYKHKNHVEALLNSTTTTPQQTQSTASNTTQQEQNNPQEILKGLFKSAIENNVEEFEKKLKDARKVSFDFFNTKLSEDYEVNNIIIDQDTNLVKDMHVRNAYSKELIVVFLKQGIITQDNVANLYGNIRIHHDLSYFYNCNFIKLSLDYIRNKSIPINQEKLERICDAVKNSMSEFLRIATERHKYLQENISKIEEVVKSLVPLLDEKKKLEFENDFYKKKSEIAKLIAPTPAQQKQQVNGDPQTVTGSATAFQHPDNTKHNSPQEQFLGISPRGWAMIATGAIVGGVIGAILAATGVIPAIAAIGIIATAVLAGIVGAFAGAVVGGGIGCLTTDIVINRCCSGANVQVAA